METLTKEQLSNTSLSQFKKSPLHYLYYKENKIEPTEAMIFGKAFHCFILENDLFKDRYFTLDFEKRAEPDKAMNSKLNIAWKADQIQSNMGKELISKEDLDTINLMYEAVQNHKPAMELLSQLSAVESKIEWIDGDTGLSMIGYIDGKGDGFKIDFKVVKDASPEGFIKDAFNKDLPRQAALYVDADITLTGQVTDFYFIPIEKTPPFGVSVQKCSRQFLNHGKLQYSNLLSDFLRWDDAGRPVAGYEWKNKQGYFDLNLPNWVR